MEEVKLSSGIGLKWGAEHYSKGKLISRQVSVEPPAPVKCIRISCLWKYLIASLTYALVLIYHQNRTIYAEKNRDKEILERYRTGKPSPKNLIQAIIANIKLTCPVCKHIETSW